MRISTIGRGLATAAVAATIGLGGMTAPLAGAATKAPARPAAPKPAAFSMTGTVVSVAPETMTISFTVKGGNQKAVKTQTVALAVPGTAKVTRDGAAATLADVLAGDHVAAQGTVTGSTYTVSKVHASSPADAATV